MAKLPNAEKAVVERRKLHDYCLSPDHPRGKHKAKVFASTLGLTAEDSGELRRMLLEAAVSEAVVPTAEDKYGQRYLLDFLGTQQGKKRHRTQRLDRSLR